MPRVFGERVRAAQYFMGFRITFKFFLPVSGITWKIAVYAVPHHIEINRKIPQFIWTTRYVCRLPMNVLQSSQSAQNLPTLYIIEPSLQINLFNRVCMYAYTYKPFHIVLSLIQYYSVPL